MNLLIPSLSKCFLNSVLPYDRVDLVLVNGHNKVKQSLIMNPQMNITVIYFWKMKIWKQLIKLLHLFNTGR